MGEVGVLLPENKTRASELPDLDAATLTARFGLLVFRNPFSASRVLSFPLIFDEMTFSFKQSLPLSISDSGPSLCEYGS